MSSYHQPLPSQPASSPGMQQPPATLATGWFVITVPLLLVFGVITHRRHRAAQLKRWILHLEKSWKLISQNPQR
jgi:hypothetical protein